MKHAEYDYLELGRRLESATGTNATRDVQWDIRWRIAQEETEDDRDLARQLVERGRQEIRSGQ